MRYDNNMDPEWIPSSWKAAVLFPSGELFEESENDDVEVALGLELPDDRFQIAYPKGTSVKDDREGGKFFTAEEGGRLVPKRQVAAQAASDTNRPYWIVAGGVAAAIGIALVLWRRKTWAG
jgi:hypothetical protein